MINDFDAGCCENSLATSVFGLDYIYFGFLLKMTVIYIFSWGWQNIIWLAYLLNQYINSIVWKHKHSQVYLLYVGLFYLLIALR